jgi:hypothetical protein
MYPIIVYNSTSIILNCFVSTNGYKSKSHGVRQKCFKYGYCGMVPMNNSTQNMVILIAT